MKHPSRRAGSQRGQAAVEFMLTALSVVFILAFVLEMISFAYTYNVLAYAAKEGLRYAVVHGASNSVVCAYPCTGSATTAAAAVTSVVTNTAKQSFHDVSGLQVNVTYPDGDTKAPNRVQVNVSYTYSSYARLGFSPGLLYASATGRILN